MYSAYLKLYRLDLKIPESVQTFMVMLHHKYSGSTLWTIYSCLNSWYKAKHGLNLKQWPVHTGLMKTITTNHVIKKAPTFTSTNMEGIFKTLRDDSEHQNFEGRRSLLRLVGTSLAYYGLCRTDDLLKIKCTDLYKERNETGEEFYTVKYEAKIYDEDDKYLDEAMYLGAGKNAVEKRKNTTEPFTFDLPTSLTKEIDTYLSMIPERVKNDRLIKNANKRIFKLSRWNFFLNCLKKLLVNTGIDGNTCHKTVEYGCLFFSCYTVKTQVKTRRVRMLNSPRK